MTPRDGVVLLVSVLLLAGCRKVPEGEGPAMPQPRGEEPAAVTAPAAEAPTGQVPASSASLARVPSSCAEGREVSAGGDQVPEGVLWEAYRLAVGPDGEEAQVRFVALWGTGAPERHIREHIWPRVREHVAKYVKDPAKPTYVLCRSLPVGSDRMRLFVKSFDDRKSDPPTVLLKEKGTWKIDVMTP